ncbi:hypothetical protein SY88_12615 [Clostridiales bacterium PH28_bin88]|nr:hypothetical protein SY88_12615 [Clostridiales bacterium PH28_bin88]
MAWIKLREILWDNPFQKWFLAGLVIVNALGSVWGYIWYRNQFAATPWQVWPFVPDSPLSSTLMTMALFTLLVGRRNVLFQLLAFTAVIKYGLWAVVLITDFWLAGGQQAVTEWMLWLSHLGMAAEGYLFLRHLPVRAWHVALVGGWMAFNDYVDYAWGLHPYLFTGDQLLLALVSAVALTAFISTTITLLYLKGPGMKHFRAE